MYFVCALASIVGDNVGSFPIRLEFSFFEGPVEDKISFANGLGLTSFSIGLALILNHMNGNLFPFFFELIQGLFELEMVV